MLQICGSENSIYLPYMYKGTMRRWLSRYAASRKVAGSKPDKMNEFSSIYPILLTALGPGDFSSSNKMSTRSRK
jgi:hypothetical protein